MGIAAHPAHEPEQVSLRLEFVDNVGAWVHAGRLLPLKRRQLSVFTDEHVYVHDDLSVEKLRVANLKFSERYESGASRSLEYEGVELGAEVTPMMNLMRCFVDGLLEGASEYFGLELAVQVARVIERCDAALATGRGRADST